MEKKGNSYKKIIFHSFTLDPFQVEAVEAIERDESVVVSAATGTGKTLIADYGINYYLEKGKKIIYTAPIKALSNQKYYQFSKEYGDDKVGLMTGDIVINPKGDILIMTVEIYRNMLMVSDPMIEQIACVIFDEIHFINDRERGIIWEESIIFSPDHIRFIALSATIPNADQFAGWIQSIKKHEIKVVEFGNRAVPLTHKYFDRYHGELTYQEYKKVQNELIKQIKKGNFDKFFENKPYHTLMELISKVNSLKLTPALVFVFSRAKAEAFSFECSQKSSMIDKNHVRKIERIINQILEKDDEVYQLSTTKKLIKSLKKGIGFHHAGLLPKLKFLVEKIFENGLLKFLFTTETFAVGINMPAKTVIFSGIKKFDGISFRYIKTKEYYQMAGRAGRRGLDKEGHVYSYIDMKNIDKNFIKNINKGDIEPIKSKFQLSYNTAINLARLHTKKKAIYLLQNSFFEYQSNRKKSKIPYLYERKIEVLKKKGYLTEGGNLTPKGYFLSKIYTESLLVSELFNLNNFFELSHFEWFFLLTLVIYEPGKKDKFYFKRGENRDGEYLIHKFGYDSMLFQYFNNKDGYKLYGFTKFWWDGGSFLDLVKKTSLLEGDIIRLFRMTIDLIFQISNATSDEKIVERLKYIVYMVEREYISFEHF